MWPGAEEKLKGSLVRRAENGTGGRHRAADHHADLSLNNFGRGDLKLPGTAAAAERVSYDQHLKEILNDAGDASDEPMRVLRGGHRTGDL